MGELLLEETESTFPAQKHQQEAPTFCGVSITLKKTSEKYLTWRPATIGGIILLDGRPYALTAAHIFLPPRSCKSDRCCDQCDGDDHNGAAEEWEGTSWWDMQEALQDEPEDESDGPEYHNGRNYATINSDDEFVISFKDSKLGRFSTSVQLPDLQDDEQDTSHTISVSSKAAWIDLDCGWALFDLGDIPLEQCLNVVKYGDKSLPITSIKPFVPNVRLILHDNALETIPALIATPRGALEAKLFVWVHQEDLAGTDSFQPAWYIKYPHHLADVGSWMADPESGELWGMVFQVGDNGKRWGSVLPAEVLFNDIKTAMGVEKVTLPGQAELGQDEEEANEDGSEAVGGDEDGTEDDEDEASYENEPQRIGPSGGYEA